MTLEDYERESHSPVTDYSLHYRAKELDRKHFYPSIDSTRPMHPASDHYVDGRLLKTVVDSLDGRIRTCFHEHFGRKHVLPRHGSQAADLVRYVDQLRHNVKGRMLEDVNLIEHRLSGDAAQALASLRELLAVAPLKQ